MKIVAVLFVAFQLSQGYVLEERELPFIVGGERASIEDFPHSLALLDRVRGGASGYICGASNIAPLWALSAAHCLQSGTNPTMINLYGGSDSRLSGGHLFFVTGYTLHPSYSRITLDFDIAIIAVDPGTPLDGFTNVRAIPLAPACADACCGVCVAGPNVDVAGWGRVDDGTLPELLMKVDKGITSNAECSNSWRNISNRMFCTTIENGRDSCNGDSGSAAVRSGVQVGIVSFGSTVCGDGSRPAVYVRIEDPAVRSWIASFTGF